MAHRELTRAHASMGYSTQSRNMEYTAQPAGRSAGGRLSFPGSSVLLTILKAALLASASFRWQVLSQYFCSFVCLSFFITALITYSDKVWHSKSAQFHWLHKAILSCLDFLLRSLTTGHKASIQRKLLHDRVSPMNFY